MDTVFYVSIFQYEAAAWHCHLCALTWVCRSHWSVRCMVFFMTGVQKTSGLKAGQPQYVCGSLYSMVQIQETLWQEVKSTMGCVCVCVVRGGGVFLAFHVTWKGLALWGLNNMLLTHTLPIVQIYYILWRALWVLSWVYQNMKSPELWTRLAMYGPNLGVIRLLSTCLN